MNLLDRYITEIGKHLPRKSRADIETEIRSTLEDMLQDLSQKSGRPADDALISDMLKAYGAPDKVAAAYLPERYLIGPRLFPVFTLVLKIVFIVLTVLALIGLGFRLGTSPLTAQAFGEILVQSITSFLGVSLTAFGNIVFIFAILQWALPASEWDDQKPAQEWEPASLLAEPEPDQVRMWEPISAIVFTLVAILIFNFYPQIVGMHFFSDGKWTSVPLLSDVFFSYLPWINGLWILQIILNVVLLRQGRWQPLTRWFEVGLSCLGIAIAGMLLQGPSLVVPISEMLAQISLEPHAAQTLALMFSQLPVGVIALIIVLESIDVVKSIYRLVLKPKPLNPAQIK